MPLHYTGHPWMHLVMRSVASVCLGTCLSVCLSCSTFSCSNFWKPWPRNFIFWYVSRSRSSITVMGQGHTSINKYTFVGGLPSAKRQSCSLFVLDWKLRLIAKFSIHQCIQAFQPTWNFSKKQYKFFIILKLTSTLYNVQCTTQQTSTVVTTHP